MSTTPAGVSPNWIEVLDHLESDGLVAFPTETVWGLAARAESKLAVERLRDFKGRSREQPISLMIDEPSALYDFGVASSELLRAVVETFWPGPLTVVVAVAPDRARFAPGIENSAGAVGFRCSDHPVAGALVREARGRGLGPLTATSFNRTGETPVQTHSEAVQLAKLYESHGVSVLNSNAPEDSVPTPSTVLDLSGGEPRVLRWGAVSEQALAPLLDRFC